MNRLINFSAGPAVLPVSVLERARDEMLTHGNDGMSVMEMSHRSPMYEKIIGSTEQLLRELMNIPDSYKVLFLQGGASTQFAMVPLNLLNGSGRADYAITGQWAKKAHEEGSRYGTCSVVASSKDKTFCYIPEIPKEKLDSGADYFHLCQNNTIYGTRFSKLPDTGDVPVVSDMSSCILSEPVDVSRYGLIYAGAQKNMGPAGLTVVILREDLIGRHRESTPTMLQYKTHTENGSMYNTPPTYAVYVCKLVLEWVKEQGGLRAMERINREKAALLYDYLDASAMFSATVQGEDRSIMNIPFVTGVPETDKKFIKEAAAEGLVNLAGHRSVGGMRASIYNAMPVEGVKTLVEFMRRFEQQNA